jgi:hypothetical protein
MNTSATTTYSPIALLAAAMFLTSLAAMPHAAEARDRATTVTGANGKTATRNVSRAEGDVQSSSTGPNGNTTSRSVDRSAENGVVTTDTSVTGPKGQTATRTASHSATGGTATVTGPNGKSATRTTTVTP